MKLETLEAYMKAYGKAVYTFCLYLTRNRQDAEDLYQDTFLKLIELHEKLELEKNPKGYLLSVAVHLWTNKKRKIVRRQRIAGSEISMDEIVLEIPSTDATPEEWLIETEKIYLVRKAVYSLAEKYRLPILLYYMEGQKISEIAKILHIPEGTVKTRLSRAKKQLEKELEVVFYEKNAG